MSKSSSFASELSPKFAILGFLYIQPMHGYELHKQLEANLQELWRISQSQAYSILKHLEKDGLITATRQQQNKKPDRALLTITDQGKAQFEGWLHTPSPGSARAIRVEFITRLFFSSQVNPRLCARLIQEQEDKIRSDLASLHQRLNAISSHQTYNRLGLELRIRQLMAVQEWIADSLSSFIATGK
jgi:DNA-binding PadR family transcriptional regulator